MRHSTFLNYAATFLTSLAAFTVVGFLYLSLHNNYNGIKIIEPLEQPFKVLNKTVQAGHPVFYEIAYHKYFDIPGDLTKQLIVTPKDGKRPVYIPLPDVAGHLPEVRLKVRLLCGYRMTRRKGQGRSN